MARRTVLVIVMVVLIAAVVLTASGRNWLIDRLDDASWLLYQFKIVRP